MVQKNYSCEDTESLKWDNSKMTFPFEIRLVFSFVLFAIYVSKSTRLTSSIYIKNEKLLGNTAESLIETSERKKKESWRKG